MEDNDTIQEDRPQRERMVGTREEVHREQTDEDLKRATIITLDRSGTTEKQVITIAEEAVAAVATDMAPLDTVQAAEEVVLVLPLLLMRLKPLLHLLLLPLKAHMVDMLLNNLLHNLILVLRLVSSRGDEFFERNQKKRSLAVMYILYLIFPTNHKNKSYLHLLVSIKGGMGGLRRKNFGTGLVIFLENGLWVLGGVFFLSSSLSASLSSCTPVHTPPLQDVRTFCVHFGTYGGKAHAPSARIHRSSTLEKHDQHNLHFCGSLTHYCPFVPVQDKYTKCYNVGPTKYQPVMIWQEGENGGRTLRAMKWGLVPVWSKSATPHPCPVNARTETIHEKNTFRRLIDNRRCVILANGYFEWKRTGPSQGPYFFTPHSSTFSQCEKSEIKSEKATQSAQGAIKSEAENKTLFSGSDHPMLRMAGLYDIWHNPETGEKVYSYTVLTVFASNLTGTIHDRMPALLWNEEDVDAWINPSNPYQKVKHLLEPSETLTIWPVSEIVGNVRNDVPACIEPISREKTEKKLITSFFKPQTKKENIIQAVKREQNDADSHSSSSSLQSTLPNSWATEDLNDSMIDETGNPIIKHDDSQIARNFSTDQKIAVKLEMVEDGVETPRNANAKRSEPTESLRDGEDEEKMPRPKKSKRS